MRYIEGALNLHYFVRNQWMPSEKETLMRFIHAYRQEYSVYLSLYSYPEKGKTDADVYGPMCFDVDCENNVERAQEDAVELLSYFERVWDIPKAHAQIYFSGNKGFHVLYSPHILGVLPERGLNARYRSVARKVAALLPHGTLDLQIYDARRLLRVVNTRHEKSGFFKVPLDAEQLSSLSIDEIRQRAMTPRPIVFPKAVFSPTAAKQFCVLGKPPVSLERTPQTRDISFEPPCVQYLWTNEVKQSDRHNRLVLLASHCIQRNYSQETALYLLSVWNTDYAVPPLSQSHVDYMVQYMYNRGGYNYGCSTFSQYHCDTVTCPFARQKQRTG